MSEQTSEGVLCFVQGPFMYFTTQPLAVQWGDDWNDAPYEYNAGTPYETADWTITRVAYEGPFEQPCTYEGPNSPWSVEQINKGEVPWLQTDRYDGQQTVVKIYAGTPFSKVVEAIQSIGGTVYVPVPRKED